MKSHRMILGVAAALSIGGMASPSLADTQYYFSGNACQPTDSANFVKIQVLGAGISNKDTTSFSSATVTCPVTGIISTTLNQTGLKVHVRNGVTGFWELDNQTFGTIWWSSNKSSPGTGSANITWSGTELFGSAASNYSAYSFRGTIGGRCNDVSCNPEQSWIQAYWVTHTQA
jgi:hypothetical protein